MKKVWSQVIVALLMLIAPAMAQARQWTFQECIDYALANNITLQKSTINHLSAIEDVKQSRAELLPSLSFSTTQNGIYTPWQESGKSTVANGYVQSTADKIYYNGSYGVNAQWTVWNGNRNTNTLKLNKLAEEKAALDSAVTANNIQEQIAQLYVQILYSAEAVKVNEESLNSSKENEERGKEMVRVGSMSEADLAQLSAQRAQDEYNVVQAQSAVSNYKRQLKQLLQLTDEDFDVVIPSSTDAEALQEIPAVNSVFASAIEHRPEIKAYQNLIDQSALNLKLAYGQRMPSVVLSGGVGTNTTSMSNDSWSNQMKTNFDASIGVTLSVPIFDNRQSKTAIRKAKLQQTSAQLDLQDQKTSLYSTIENYWLQATTNQSQFRAAKTSSESAQKSYDLLSEQFRLGLKNIVELRTGKDNLLMAKQNELQAKYLTILNEKMLAFYKDGVLR